MESIYSNAIYVDDECVYAYVCMCVCMCACACKKWVSV